MGVIWIVICCVAAVLLFRDGSKLFIPAVANAVANLCSLGIMHNYGLGDIRENYERVAITVNTLTLPVGIVFLVVAIVR